MFTANVEVELVLQTSEYAVNALNNQLCVFQTEAHGRLKLQDIFPGAICANTDSILFL